MPRPPKPSHIGQTILPEDPPTPPALCPAPICDTPTQGRRPWDSSLLLTKPPMFLSGTSRFYGICTQKRESRRADSNRLPLLITSARSLVAERCRGVQIPHK
jgi:hypothetical protein